MKKRKYVKTDSQIQFYPVRWPTYFNSINFIIIAKYKFIERNKKKVD